MTVGEDGEDVRKGVTVILPRSPDEIHIPCYAGMHTLNGNGEVSGSYQVTDWGYTNTVRSPSSNLININSLPTATCFDQFGEPRNCVSHHLAMDIEASARKWNLSRDSRP